MSPLPLHQFAHPGVQGGSVQAPPWQPTEFSGPLCSAFIAAVYPPFTEEEMGPERGELPCLGPHSYQKQHL